MSKKYANLIHLDEIESTSQFHSNAGNPKHVNQKLDIQKIIRIEPRVKSILDIAEVIPKGTYYDYVCLKKALTRLVGFLSDKVELQSSEAYDIVLHQMLSLLKPRLDLR